VCTPVGTGEGEEDGGEGGGGEVDMEAGEDGMEETGESPIIAITLFTRTTLVTHCCK